MPSMTYTPIFSEDTAGLVPQAPPGGGRKLLTAAGDFLSAAEVWGHRTVTSADSPFTASGEGVLYVDASAGPVQIRVPAADSLPADYALWLQRVDDSAHGVMVTPLGGTIHGAASLAVESQDDTYFVATRGANWNILLFQPGGGLVQSDKVEIEIADFSGGLPATREAGWTTRLPHHLRHGVVLTVDLTTLGSVTEIGLMLLQSGQENPTSGVTGDWAPVRADNIDRETGESLTMPYVVRIPVGTAGRYTAIFPVPAASYTVAQVWAVEGDASTASARVYAQRWVR